MPQAPLHRYQDTLQQISDAIIARKREMHSPKKKVGCSISDKLDRCAGLFNNPVRRDGHIVDKVGVVRHNFLHGILEFHKDHEFLVHGQGLVEHDLEISGIGAVVDGFGYTWSVLVRTVAIPPRQPG